MEEIQARACELMALWVYNETTRPKDVIASKETIWRMLNGFTNPNSSFRQFAFDVLAMMLREGYLSNGTRGNADSTVATSVI
jgi:hypothetical protein